MSEDRTDRVLAALVRRISRQGDMPIRVSRHTLRVLMRALGVGGWDRGEDDFREIDALALDVLLHLALKARAFRDRKSVV